jgi:hypothetical protein
MWRLSAKSFGGLTEMHEAESAGVDMAKGTAPGMRAPAPGATPPDSASVRNLKLTLDNILDHASATVVVPASIEGELAGMAPRYAVCRAMGQTAPDAIALEGVLPWDQAGSRITETLAKTKEGGAVLIRLELDPHLPAQREDIMVRFARTFPDFAIRILGLPSPGAIASPWAAVSRRLPRVLLFMSASRAGKTNAVMDLAIRSGIRAVYGDQVLEGLATGQLEGPDGLQAVARAAQSVPDWAQAIRGIFEGGHTEAFLELIVKEARGADFLFDMWVPLSSRAGLAKYFADHGYFVFQPDADATSTALTNEAATVAAIADAEAISAEIRRLEVFNDALHARVLAAEQAAKDAGQAAKDAEEAQRALAREAGAARSAEEALRLKDLAGRARNRALVAQIKAIKASRSWRLTRPFRAFARKVRRLLLPA